VRVAFGGVNFDFNKATIRSEAGPVLNQWSERLSGCPEVALQIEGHTDATGPEAYNQVLSERRANSVRDYLVSRGIDASRLNPVGRGETRPVASNSTREGRGENRRVEIIAQ
jgi:OOP family OmpA-OmpF porin